MQYLEDTDGHCYASNRDEVPLNPFLPRPQTAALVDNIGIVLPLEVSQTRQEVSHCTYIRSLPHVVAALLVLDDLVLLGFTTTEGHSTGLSRANRLA